MLARLAVFVFCLLGGAAAGWLFAGEWGIAVGIIAGSIAWFVIETLRARRVLLWLKAAGERQPPAVGGLWGEAMDRARRALAARSRETAEAQARLQEFLAAIQGSPDGVVLMDARGRIEWCNETAAAQFGLDPQRDLGQQIGNLVRHPYFSAYHQGGRYDHDIVITSPGSTALRPQRLAVRLHPYGQGRLLLLSRDVTAVEQAETMRRDFVANVSHEIRTPLTVLAGFVETLQSLDLPADERRRYLQLMGQQAHRMQTLVSDLLTLSRLEGSPLPGPGEWTPAAVLLAQVEQESRALSATLGKAQELRFTAPAGLEVGGSASELLSAASNLVSNAVRYTPASGQIEAHWRVLPDGRAEFVVTDTGPGIAPEHLPRLTERFYRVDRSRSRETGGTGLGLAIVKHVVQRHGGELKVESTPGAGSRFAIQFPASRVRSARPADSAARPATESAAG
jgi:two-component system phosphate regulon sensor histidine kinase PhoR